MRKQTVYLAGGFNSDPNFTNSKLKLEEHLRFLISQPIREFQEYNKVKIEKVDICLLEGSVEKVKIKIVKCVTV